MSWAAALAGLGGGAREVGRQTERRMDLEEEQRRLEEQRAFQTERDQFAADQNERLARLRGQIQETITGLQNEGAMDRADLGARSTQQGQVNQLQLAGFEDATEYGDNFIANPDFDPLNPNGKQAFTARVNPRIYEGERSLTPMERATLAARASGSGDRAPEIWDPMDGQAVVENITADLLGAMPSPDQYEGGPEAFQQDLAEKLRQQSRSYASAGTEIDLQMARYLASLADMADAGGYTDEDMLNEAAGIGTAVGGSAGSNENSRFPGMTIGGAVGGGMGGRGSFGGGERNR